MNTITGILASTLVCGNLILASLPLFLLAIVRALLKLLRLSSAASWLTARMDLIIDYWVGGNRLIFRAFGIFKDETRWENADRLSRHRWYLAISNHQSWPDILILQTIFKRTPAIKFFTKRQLLFIPFFGQAMWCLGFPYVRRMSREQIAANPALLELDRQAIRDASQGFRNHPTTVLNFLEGTRFTPAKHAAQNARFKALLNPKSGGLAMVLSALEQEIDCLIDVTIDYPDRIPTFWEFMKGESPRVEVLAQCLEIPSYVKDAANDDDRRRAVEAWVEDLWRAKDARLRNRHAAGSMEAAG
jgi:1-acyl-sn-glycerol-3-phosphate acyltransferase